MSERYSPRDGRTYGRAYRVLAAFALAGVAAGFVGGCSSAAKSPKKHIAAVKHVDGATPPINRCFDKAIPEPKAPAMPNVPGNPLSPSWPKRFKRYEAAWRNYNQVTDPSKIVLRPGPGKSVQGDPISLPDGQQSAVDNATVKVVDSGGYGTGFIVRGAHGKDVVVTAAHVLAGAKGPIDVISDQGKKTSVTRACYVYQDNRKLQPLKESRTATEDIAVLDLAQPIGGKALKLATTEPSRGTWVAFTNDQSQFFVGSEQDGDPTQPSQYEGMILTSPSSYLGFMVLTGIEPWYGSHNWDEYSVTPGASGGPVTKGDTVIGMTVTGPESNQDIDSGIIETEPLSYIDSLYNVTATGSLVGNPNMGYSDDGLITSTEIAYTVARGDY